MTFFSKKLERTNRNSCMASIFFLLFKQNHLNFVNLKTVGESVLISCLVRDNSHLEEPRESRFNCSINKFPTERAPESIVFTAIRDQFVGTLFPKVSLSASMPVKAINARDNQNERRQYVSKILRTYDSVDDNNMETLHIFL